MLLFSSGVGGTPFSILGPVSFVFMRARAQIMKRLFLYFLRFLFPTSGRLQTGALLISHTFFSIARSPSKERRLRKNHAPQSYSFRASVFYLKP